ncbi:hypothetical protein BV25DRAFT_1864971 [Artomyces pyxidatus]|uniref:Uncharacterized protein n=1 Tax=Artomyces pyxidatus TaxID=48021 RepID=A0ACB8SK90_9AGAM|nr:hypothetical protein BV25DRAFT_1864971 [Artomyces pyxidatus]
MDSPSPLSASSLPAQSEHPSTPSSTLSSLRSSQEPFRAPVHNLPVELLSRIFLLGYSDGLDPHNPFKRAALEAAPTFELLVSHVCHHWRRVALRTPRLWTHLRVRQASHVDRARAFAERSRTAHIDVYLEAAAAADHVSGRTLGLDDFAEVFAVLTPHSARWRSLVVRVNDLAGQDAAYKCLAGVGRVPHLRTLQLWHLQDWGSAQSLAAGTARPPRPLFVEHPPRLAHLSLVGVHLPWEQASWVRGLTHLELALHPEAVRPSAEQWERIFRRCPDLARLALHYSGPRVEPVSRPFRTIWLPQLTHLSLSDTDLDMLCQILRQLVMPNVRTLELELPDQDYTPALELISGKVFPHLDRLRVTALDCTADAWEAFLAAATTLSYLEVDFRRVPIALFAALVTRIPRPPDLAPDTPFSDVRLPNLQVLKVAGLRSCSMCQFMNFRRDAGHSVPQCFVHRTVRDREMDALCVQYFVYSDDDDEDADELELLDE